MGFSTRQFVELVVLIIFTLLYPIVPLVMMSRYEVVYRFMAFTLPYILLVLYLSFKAEGRKNE